MRILGMLALAATMFCSSVVAQTVTNTGTDSDRIRTFGGTDSADLYGSGNDDTFQSYGIVTFNFTAADFGLSSLTGIDSANLNLTFNDRGFSDGTQFELYYTPDDFDGTYTGLTYVDTGLFDPTGIDASQFSSVSSLGVIDLGFDSTDGATNGGVAFDYAVDFSSVVASLVSEINAGSDFSLLVAAVDNADDITFSGVGNTFDPGDPALSLTTTAVPEPSAFALLGLAGFGLAVRRRRR